MPARYGRMMSTLHLLAALLSATVCAAAAQRLNLPGGLILGAMVGSSTVTMLTGTAIDVPKPVRDGAFIVIGTAIGVTITRQAIAQLAPIIVPAVLSGLLLIAAGIGIVFLLRAVGVIVPGDVLATSPGALSVMSALAVEEGTGPAEVALFHLVRVVMVVITLPLLLPLLRTTP